MYKLLSFIERTIVSLNFQAHKWAKAIVLFLFLLLSPAVLWADDNMPQEEKTPSLVVVFVTTATEYEKQAAEQEVAEELALVLERIEVKVVAIPQFHELTIYESVQHIHAVYQRAAFVIWLEQSTEDPELQVRVWRLSRAEKNGIAEDKTIFGADPTALAINVMEFLNKQEKKVRRSAQGKQWMSDNEIPWQDPLSGDDESPKGSQPLREDIYGLGIFWSVGATLPSPTPYIRLEPGGGLFLHYAPYERFVLQIPFTAGLGPFYKGAYADLYSMWFEMGVIIAFRARMKRTYIGSFLGGYGLWRRARIVEEELRWENDRLTNVTQYDEGNFRGELGAMLGVQVTEMLDLTLSGAFGVSANRETRVWWKVAEITKKISPFSWRATLGVIVFFQSHDS